MKAVNLPDSLPRAGDGQEPQAADDGTAHLPGGILFSTVSWDLGTGTTVSACPSTTVEYRFTFFIPSDLRVPSSPI